MRRMCGPAHPWTHGVVLLKSERIAELMALAHAMPGAALLPLIETALGFTASLDLARALGVSRRVFGTIDFQFDMGIDSEGDWLPFFRSQLVLHSRPAGLQVPVDGVSTVLDDAAEVHVEAHRARRLGFVAKLYIHPRQIGAVHRAS